MNINICKMIKNRFQTYIKYDIKSIKDFHLYQGQIFTHTTPKCVKNSNWSQLFYEPPFFRVARKDENFLIKSISSSSILCHLYLFGGKAQTLSWRSGHLLQWKGSGEGSWSACRFWYLWGSSSLCAISPHPFASQGTRQYYPIEILCESLM